MAFAAVTGLGGCGGSDNPPAAPPAACSVAAQTGCAQGQQCMTGKDGNPACFCSANANTGCAAGLECQVVASGGADCFCSVDQQTGCESQPGLTCQPVLNGNSACFPPVSVDGQVFDLATQKPIEGARVVARDVNNASVSGVAVSDATGHYELKVPAMHDANGGLVSEQVLLRADAAGYLTFPRAPRVSLPVDVSKATGEPPVVQSSATDIALIALPDTTGLGTVSGTVHADAPRGTLVVAGSATGIADTDGSYTVFNVAAGSVQVSGYKAGLQLDHATANVAAGQTTEHVDLNQTGAASSVVSGNVEIVNPGQGKDTSIILVVEDTFDQAVASGETPPGLRVGNVSGAWSIPNVPDGKYVVLAAFENDYLVRDPDTSIGGTSLVHVTVSGGNVPLSEGFKITGSLDGVSPDAEQAVSGTPSFVWDDDAGEDHYTIVVFDAFGQLVWENDSVPGVSGSATVTVQYGGPALQSGSLYQFRATSIKKGGTPISRTEDLRGVFLYQ